MRRWHRGRKARRESEHGVIMILVALFLSNALLLGMAAIVIDVGMAWQEREELISGADAASMKVALNCVATPAKCTVNDQLPVARAYARKNAKDDAADAQICLSTALPCPAWKTAAACPPLPAVAAGETAGTWVEVRTTTVTASGTTFIPPAFGKAATNGKYTGKSVGACARVAWGPPAVKKVLALGISLCDWERMTNNGSTFYGPLGGLLNTIGLLPVLGQPSVGVGGDSPIAAALPAAVLGLPLPSCTTPFINLTKPRGYVWLQGPDIFNPTMPDANCELDLKVGDEPRSFLLGGLTVGGTNRCGARLQALIASKQPVLVPIFDKIEQTLLSVAPRYRIAGFAPLQITGFSGLLGGLLGSVSSIVTGNLFDAVTKLLCDVASGCIYGYFTKTLVPTYQPRFGTGSNVYGATVIGRTG
jgi:Flp pilus assembly protein TadG